MPLKTVEASYAAPSQCMPMDSDAYDVDVEVEFPDGSVVGGEVTLRPEYGDRAHYVSWGSPDHWVSGDLLVQLRAEFPDASDFRAALYTIEMAAREEIRKTQMI